MPQFPLPPSAIQIWAVEDTSIQLTWGSIQPGRVEATVDGGTMTATVEHSGGPGSIEVTGLRPDSNHRVDLVHPEGQTTLSAKTLPSPDGACLCKVATISDLHLGSTRWGASKTMFDRSGDPEGFPMRCARAAIAEAIAWGADLLIVKGDAAHHQSASDYELVGRLLDEFDQLPVVLVPGNHDVDGRTDDPVPAKVGARGIPFVRDAVAEDLPGVRIIAADTTVPGSGAGSVVRIGSQIVDLATETDGPYLLAIHHHLQPYRYPAIYPVGVPTPESTDLLTALTAGNPRGLITSGHTHRNRSRQHGPLITTEVGSTRDWPGVWAGYAIHEGGIRQVVKRAAAPDAIAWHEYSRRALLGWWGTWAAGRLRHRCFTHPWPSRPT